MARRYRIFLIVGLASAAFFSAAVGGLYWACQQSPEFYLPALGEDRSAAKAGSDAMLREAASLVSNLRRSGHWQALFTAEQINGWLAYDMQQNHPRLFPSTISDPRVAMDSDRAQIVFRWHKLAWSAVVYLETEIYLREENVIAVRICKARAGMLLLPLTGLLNDLMACGQELGLQINQQEIDGDPLLLIALPLADGADDKLHLCLESLEVNKGKIYVAGRSERGALTPSLARQPSRNTETIGEDHSEKPNIHR